MRIAIEALGQLARSGQLNQMGQCTIFQSVRHLLMHLSLPNEGGPHPPPMMMPGGARDRRRRDTWECGRPRRPVA